MQIYALDYSAELRLFGTQFASEGTDQSRSTTWPGWPPTEREFLMRRSRRSLLAFALVLAACGETTAPDATLAPSLARGQSSRSSTTTTTLDSDLLLLQQKLAAFAGAAGLMTCQAQPTLTVSQVVGPAGGVVQIGKHALTVPKGALSSKVTITAEAVADSFNSIRFGPEGLKFAKPASLSMDYYNCLIPVLLSSAYVAFVDENKRILEKTPSIDYRDRYLVVGEINHFSRYAVAW